MNNVDNTKKLTHLSLCTGYEGIGLGLKRVLPNIREVAYVEIEAYAIFNLAKKIEQGWQVKHLFTRTLKPSHTESFEDKWIFFQEASPANPFLLQEVKEQLKTLDTCSHTLPKESESANLELFSLKMSKESSPNEQETENLFSNMSSEDWKNWVTEQRQEYSQRVKSACHTKESVSSSLAYPTPRGVAGCTEGGSSEECLFEQQLVQGREGERNTVRSKTERCNGTPAELGNTEHDGLYAEQKLRGRQFAKQRQLARAETYRAT